MSMGLKRYTFPEGTDERIRHIIALLNKGKLREVERETAKFALDVIDQILKGKILPEEADNCFTLLDLYIEDNFSEVEFSDEFIDLVFEGMLLHDLNDRHGTDISLMKKLAEKILNKKPQKGLS